MTAAMPRSTHPESRGRRALRYWASGIAGRGEYHAALARAMVLRLVVISLALATIDGGVRIASAMFAVTDASRASDHVVLRVNSVSARDRERDAVAMYDRRGPETMGRAAAIAMRVMPAVVPVSDMRSSPEGDH